MSLASLLLQELMEDERHCRHGELYDQHFGMGLLTDELLSQPKPNTPAVFTIPLKSGYLRPWRKEPAGNSGLSNVTNDSNGLTINLDVQQFMPNELKVKVVDDYLVVEGKHDEREDEHSLISRQFVRRYKLSEDIDCSQMVSNLSSDGILNLHAPRKEPKVREIPIMITSNVTSSPVIKQAEKRAKLDQSL